MVDVLKKRLEDLQLEQSKMNDKYSNCIANLQKQIKEEEEKQKNMKNQYVKVPMSVFCEIINTLESGMASDSLVKRLIILGKEQNLKNNNIDFDKDSEDSDKENFDKEKSKNDKIKENEVLRCSDLKDFFDYLFRDI